MWLSHHAVAVNMGPAVTQKRHFSFNTAEVVPVVPGKKFVNPNFVNTFTPKAVSNYNFDRKNSSQLIEIIKKECPQAIGGPVSMCRTNKRTRNSRNPPKSPGKNSRQNRNRQILNEMLVMGKESLDSVENPMEQTEMVPPRDREASLSSSEDSFIIFEPVKERQVSVCESEDSFIVFDDRSCCDEESDVEIESNLEESSDIEEDLDSSYSVIENKRVRFAEDNNLCEVHPMVKWAYAYQAARKGPWETYARDRERFKQRIFETEREIKHVFDRKHRDKIYQQRFMSTEDSM